MLLIDTEELLVETIHKGKYLIFKVKRDEIISLSDWLESQENNNKKRVKNKHNKK